MLFWETFRDLYLFSLYVVQHNCSIRASIPAFPRRQGYLADIFDSSHPKSLKESILQFLGGNRSRRYYLHLGAKSARRFH